MKIKLTKYKKIQAESKGIDEESLTRNNVNSRPLTLIFVSWAILCCFAWTLTTWFAARQNDSCGDECPDIPNSLRFDCHPDPEVTQESCQARGCCWKPPNLESLPLNIPYCYYPERYSLYKRVNSSRSDTVEKHHFVNVRPSGFPKDVKNVEVEVSCFNDPSILRLKIVDKDSSRFEVPFTNFDTDKGAHLSECDHQFILSDDEDLRFKIQHRDSGQVIFDTFNAGVLVFSDQFLQISSILRTKFIYGLGEHRKPFLKAVNWKQLSFWNADQWPSSDSTNLYGSHPFYINMDPTSKSGFGIFWLNSNAMEAILQPTPAITLRSLGGVFDLFFISGPKPEQILMEYTKIVGKPFLPPYWSLGYHQCKFDYGNLSRTKQVLEQTQKAGIPIDVQWNDIDYMDNHKDFTFSKEKFAELPAFVKDLHEQGLHYIPIIDPGISSTEKSYYKPYNLGLEMDIFIKNDSNLPFNGRVWTDGNTVWPDFTHPKTLDYWTQMFQDYHDQVPIDGAWIDMNEPSNFYDGQADGCDTKNPLNNPQYVPRSIDGHKIYHKTVCPSAKQHLGSHYDLHSLYGYTEGIATNLALKKVRKGQRPFIISRSTFPGYGHFGGHWTGDVLSDWSSLHDSVTGVLNFNLFSIPMVGADICGFNGNTTVKLCQRWMQLGAFYPFSRNHNTDNGIDQDPVSLGPSVVESAKEALTLRYSLLPFLYTLFVKAHLYGLPVVTPTFFHAMKGDEIPYFIDYQMFWGSELLIVPVLKEDTTKVEAYLPSGIWYDLRTHQKIPVNAPDFVTLEAPLEIIPVLAKGFSILPTQLLGKAKTTTQR